MNQITKISIQNIASFSQKGIEFTPQQINFIYGGNGTGKTTISNILANPEKFPHCKINRPLNGFETLVYNRRFIHQNFGQPENIKGIFILGEANLETTKNIEESQNRLIFKEEKLLVNKDEIEQKNLQSLKLIDGFKEKCWKAYKSYPSHFLSAFEGFKTKQKIADQIEFLALKSSPNIAESYEDLTKKAEVIFGKQINKASEIDELPLFNFDSLENNSIFSEVIIGKNDVDIAELITRLNNSDWVSAGRIYLENKQDELQNDCPFCQQKIDDNFKNQLDEYFDEKYLHKIEQLKLSKSAYEEEGLNLLSRIDRYKFINNQFIKIELISDLGDLIKSQFEKNLSLIDKKIKEPSLKIELENFEQEIVRIRSFIGKATIETNNHNQLLVNIDKEKELLKQQIWCFMADDLQEDLAEFYKQKQFLENNIIDIGNSQKINLTEIADLKNSIQKLESKITSIKPTINAINNILDQIGFSNFSLAESTDKISYKIIRQNGADARKTLSEGEKTLITFLYFYYLSQGSFEQSGSFNDRALVIDDPISNADEKVLIFIADLIKNLVRVCKNGDRIKQIFVLTHNRNLFTKLDFEDAKSFELRKIHNISQIGNYEKPNSDQ